MLLLGGVQDATPILAEHEVILDETNLLSEFELPGRAGEFMVRVRGQLVEAIRQALADADRHQAAMVSAAEIALAEAKARSEVAIQELNTKLRLAERQVETAGAEIIKICDGAGAALGASSPDGGHLAALGAGTVGSEISLDPVALQAAIAPLRSAAESLGQRRGPAFWPKSLGGRWLILLSSVALFLVLKPLVLVWPAIVLVARSASRIKAKREFDRLIESSQVLLHSLENSRQHAQRESQRGIEAAVGIVALAVAERDQAVNQARHSFDRRISEIRQDAAVLSAELHGEEGRLWALAAYAGAAWDSPTWASWLPDPSPEFAARLGVFILSAPDLQQRLPDINFRFRVPALIPFVDGKCLLFNAGSRFLGDAAACMQSVVIRVLANTPPGMARFTFIDPVGLGQNVADFMSLGDHDERLISGKAWTEPQHIEQQLIELTGHMETVIQKYLRTDFSTIRAFNAQAQEVAEPFHFLVVFDFPVGFSEASARRLVSIVRNGPRCGVHTFLIHDTSKSLPYGFNLADLEQAATIILWDDKTGQVTWPAVHLDGAQLIPDTIIGHRELAGTIMARCGQASVTALKVEVPFEKLFDSERALWQQSASQHLRVPLGPTGARKLQYLTFGDGLAHHGLIVGRTGSGKTNLMHVVILGLAMSYSPEEVQLYLIDLKGGVGFKPYAQLGLPHAAVVAIESEREFGISVLQGLDSELQRRFELFRAAGVNNLVDYRKKQESTLQTLPRLLLVVDEFQELFSRDDTIALQARAIFDRMVRQGRSFGLHILLGTQSLAGSAQLPTSTMGQIAVRIALPCSDADARLILADDNAAARSLSRPGEAIYNAAAGSVEGNNPFQAARLDDDELQRNLAAVVELAAERGLGFGAIVFEGNEPARVTECKPLASLIAASTWPTPVKAPVAWLGEPVAMAPPVAASFTRQTAKHLLVVSRDEAEGVGALYAAWFALLCQYRPMTARFYVLDFCTGDTPWASYSSEIRSLFGHEIEAVNRRNVSEILRDLAAEAKRRLEKVSHGEVPHYLIIAGLHRARDLRPTADSYYSPSGGEPTPAELLATILRDGPETGLHVLTWCDTVTNARRTLDRSLGEFGMRLAGPMSAEDSSLFLDCTDAARIDRPHRLLFIDDDKPGTLLKLRPYSLPELDWLESVALQQRCRPHE